MTCHSERSGGRNLLLAVAVSRAELQHGGLIIVMSRKFLTKSSILFLFISVAMDHGMSQEAGRPERNSEESKFPEAEFVGSTSFRSASLVQPLWKQLSFEGHYFGGEENNVGYVGGGWAFRGKYWKVAPGFGVAFGNNGFRTMPAIAIRWGYERAWFVSEGLYVQGLLHTSFFPEGTAPQPGEPGSRTVLPSIADGNHASVRWRRITVGGLWEHQQFRKGKEWKGGVRMVFRAQSHVSLGLYVLGPESEVRGGIWLHRSERTEK
jgi:hypothetical protein